MFSAQAGQIANALKAAGLAPDAAQKIADILGNGVQNLVRTNPETVDLTPASLRYVTPERRIHELPALDFRPGDPDFRPMQAQPSEERPAPKPADTVRREASPQQSTTAYRVSGGKYTEAKGTGDAVQVNVKVTGSGRLALLDAQSNTIVGKSFRCEADDSGLRFFVSETGTEVVWKLMLSEYLDRLGVTLPVVTSVSLGADGLQITRQMVRVLDVGRASQGLIPTAGC